MSAELIEEFESIRSAEEGTDGEVAVSAVAPGEASDAVTLYLRDIRPIPLLTAEQEVALAKAIERGKVAETRLERNLCEGERAQALADKARGEQARRCLIESNLRLVIRIARRYNGKGMPLPDLIEEGNIGLMRAVDKFDYRKGYRFSTYATYWIRQAVTRALANQSRVVRLPVHVSETMSQVTSASNKLSQELGREPTTAEIAGEVQISPRRVREIVQASQAPMSLDQPFGDGTVSELLEDEGWTSLAEEAAETLVCEGVHAALEALTDREREVVELRFGLCGQSRLTLEGVGEQIGVTRERVRQIEKEALQKLRRHGDSQSLRSLLR